MDQSSIRDLRRRLGWTQWDLAERVNVDQGTVSRWERGVESPRPATLAALRDLLLQDEHSRARKLTLARVRHSLMPAILIDPKARLEVHNDMAADYYQRDLNFDITAAFGTEFERVADRLGQRPEWELMNSTGILDGELLLARFYTNYKGEGQIIEYEPLFEDGQLLGVSVFVSGVFDFPANDVRGIERVEVVRLDEPEGLVDIYRGPMAEFARANASGPTVARWK